MKESAGTFEECRVWNANGGICKNNDCLPRDLHLCRPLLSQQTGHYWHDGNNRSRPEGPETQSKCLDPLGNQYTVKADHAEWLNRTSRGKRHSVGTVGDRPQAPDLYSRSSSVSQPYGEGVGDFRNADYTSTSSRQATRAIGVIRRLICSSPPTSHHG